MTPTPVVSTISDTARWVAAIRAMESARPDALFRDPFAARLAGEIGAEIAARMRKAMGHIGWPIVMRTKVIDDLVLAAVAEGADRVLNLAAGLDSRPYRLPLPPSLTWIEADLPAILDEKERVMQGETPACRLLRHRVDLSDAAARSAFLDGALDGASHAVVITEGLLIYLDEEAVRGLARDLATRETVRGWIVDLVSPAVLRMMRRRANPHLSPDAAMRFAPRNGVSFFAPLGWSPADIRSNLREALRANRLPMLLLPFALFSDPDPANPGPRPWGAVVRFDRDPSTANPGGLRSEAQ
jgi:methyltransferase (TIGR00027 family)